MNSRDKILQALRSPVANTGAELPTLPSTLPVPPPDAVSRFETTLVGIGGAVVRVDHSNDVAAHIARMFPQATRIVSAFATLEQHHARPHEYEDVGLAVLTSSLGVAENGAVWLTDADMPDRALPFIAQHLAVVLPASAIVATMHDAYDKIGAAGHEFGTFIAGPSKTADIEQSLVLGAHGPKSMTLFLVGA